MTDTVPFAAELVVASVVDVGVAVAAAVAVAIAAVVAVVVAVAVVDPAVETAEGKSRAHQKDPHAGKRWNQSRFLPVPQTGSGIHWIGTGFDLVATAEAKSVATVSQAVGIAETWD